MEEKVNIPSLFSMRYNEVGTKKAKLTGIWNSRVVVIGGSCREIRNSVNTEDSHERQSLTK
jgi:hypothetical protein